MFQYQMVDARDFKGRLDKKSAFETWAAKNIPVDGLHLQYTNGESTPFKGKKHEFNAASWGDYVGGDGCARRFISYRAAVVNHTIVYTWKWENEQWQPFSTQQFVAF